MDQPINNSDGAQGVTEEKKQELLQLIQQVKSSVNDFRSLRSVSEIKKEESKKNALREVFAVLLQNGINLNDQERVRIFIEKLRAENPEQAKIFEDNIDALLE